ncbi:DUF3187 family protein, partial [bacterium]|nr:DUF3187 family protein [bacterium]
MNFTKIQYKRATVAYKTFLILIQLVLLSGVAFGDSKHVLDRPLAIGPQYPLVFMSTVFEPNTAFLLKAGEMSFQASYTRLNSFVYSSNSDKADNPSGSADVFHDIDATGYSVYLDGEMDRRLFNFNYGYSDNIELQFSYRDFLLYPGSLDSTIENFHKSFGFGNQGRENAGVNELGIYIHDNQTNENVFVIEERMEEFKQESITLGVRFLVKETKNEAISISFSSNFGDYFTEREVNESTADIDQPAHRDFNDYNVALRYSS